MKSGRRNYGSKCLLVELKGLARTMGEGRLVVRMEGGLEAEADQSE